MDSPSEVYEDALSAAEECQQMEGVFHSHLDEKVRPYIDLIDSLRVIGIEKDLALPAIAVIGDQSSGKSSVLEVLSGVALPRGSGIVTRCPLELKLRKLRGGIHWKASISYRDEFIQFDDPSQVERYVAEAQNKLAGVGVGICDELITLEISSPDVSDLTLIDLPGIARVPVKGQPDDIGDQIKSLILNLIHKTETIILVVVPCNVDIATTEALKMAQEVDPEGKRTLAILTKPDLVDKGTEKNVLDIVRNQVIPLSKGYIIVKCRGQKQIDDRISLSDVTRMERDFFKRHDYFSGLLKEEKATTECLATKLTQDLVDHIKKSLPLISEQIKKQLWDTRKELSLCESGPPLEPHEKKSYLIDTLTQFNDKINRLSTGEVVQHDNLFIQLRSEFQNWKEHLEGSKGTFHETVQEVVREYDMKHRGRELAGFNNYSVFEMVVQRLVVELKGPAINTMKIIRDMVQQQFTNVAKTSFMNYPFLQCVSLNKIDNIQSTQESLVQERILEQFEMEQLVYTQDDIYYKSLNECKAAGGEKASQDNCADWDSRSNYPDMPRAYYENKIDNIQSTQESLVQERIMEQFEMEQLVYTQDGIYCKSLNECKAAGGEKASQDNCAEWDSRSKYPDMLRAYYEIVVQRLADQVPMLIRYFLLKESGRMLCREMLNLMDGSNVNEILREESEVSRKRIDMQNRQERLTLAQKKISNFF